MRDPSRQNMQSYSGFANIAGAESARGGGKRGYGASGGAHRNRSSYGGKSDVGSNIGSRLGGTSTKNLDPQQREALLKKRQMDEIQRKKAAKEKAQGGKGAKFSKDEDFEKLFGQDVEKFLDDSEWDIDSIDKLSYLSKGSKGSVRSASQAGKLRGLEKLYLQRIETSVNKNTLQMTGGIPGAQKGATAAKKNQKFRGGDADSQGGARKKAWDTQSRNSSKHDQSVGRPFKQNK
jgi:hypothetical protein